MFLALNVRSDFGDGNVNRLVNRVSFWTLDVMHEFGDGNVNRLGNRVLFRTLSVMIEYGDGIVNPLTRFALQVSPVSNIKHFIIQLNKSFPWQ